MFQPRLGHLGYLHVCSVSRLDETHFGLQAGQHIWQASTVRGRRVEDLDRDHATRKLKKRVPPQNVIRGSEVVIWNRAGELASMFAIWASTGESNLRIHYHGRRADQRVTVSREVHLSDCGFQLSR